MAALVICAVSSLASADAPRPNVVLIMVDDMGYNELGVTGQLERTANGLPAIETPNIDSLGQQGLMLSQFYATPICASSRSAILTGMHNGHSSIDRNGGNNGGNAMRPEDVTIAQQLKTVGYTTGQFGKWGQGGYNHTITGGGVDNPATAAITHPDATPSAKGFDEYYGYLNQVHAHDYYVNFLWEHDTDGSGDPGGMQIDLTSTSDYSHDLIAQKSLDFISNHADSSGQNPFFMYAPYTIPHSQFNPPNDAIRQAFIAAGYSNSQANYAAMMKRLDNTVGDIVDRLKDPDGDGSEADSVYDNTLILYMSDNGGTPQNSLFNGGGGLRGQKGSVYEGGTKSPFIAHWNGTIAPGQTNTTRIAGIDDMFATLADLAGAERPVELDGVSIARLFTGGRAEKRDVFVFEGNGSAWSIRMGDWKLVDGSELYNLAADPNESNNVAGANPMVAALMQQIGLDEGVLSDAGSGAAQTTHIVQYKSWNPQGGSNDWESTANWSGGTEFNTRGTPANNFSTGPSDNWMATIDNTTGAASEAAIDTDSRVLALDAAGSSAPLTIRIAGGASLMVRNGAVIRDGATVEINGGELHTMRAIRIEPGGGLTGSGDVSTSYDTAGTPFELKADVVNAGVIEVFPVAAATSDGELIENGGFETGVQSDGDPTYQFSEIDAWQTDAAPDFDAALANNAPAGAYRGLVAVRADDTHNTLQNTGHTIALGDELTLEFAHRGFSNWDQGVDEIVASVFYLDESQTRQVLDSFSASPLSDVWTTETVSIVPIGDTDAVGRDLWIAFDAVSGDAVTQNEFASIDGVSLTLESITTASLSILTVGGDFEQTSDGGLILDLMGGGGVAGADYDRLVVTGDATVAGALEVRVASGYQPDVDDEFEVLAAGSLQGVFDSVTLPDLSGGLTLTASYTPTGVILTVTGVLGDYNLDGVVDAADFTVWRDTQGHTGDGLAADGDRNGVVDAADLGVWRSNFGASVSVSQSIPEPRSASLILLPTGLALFMMQR